MLQLGDQGDAVRAWQHICGTRADGKFGPGTDAAVKAWQAAHDVEPDGVIGPITRAAVEPGDLIKPYEGLRLTTYDDHDGVPMKLMSGIWRRPDGGECMGYPTIGWGRRLYPGQKIEHCTRAEADEWFNLDLEQTRLPAVRRYVPGDAARICAATSCAYNCGTGWLAQLAAANFTEPVWMSRNRTKGVINTGLTMRRAEEYALWAGYDSPTT